MLDFLYLIMKKIKKNKKKQDLVSYYGFTKAEQKKYPVVTGVLRQITPEKAKKEIKAIRDVKLPADIQKWIKEYEKVGDRDDISWKLFFKLKEKVDNSFSIKISQKSLKEVKFLIAMFVVLLDDIADKKQNSKLLDELLKIPFYESYIELEKLTENERKYLKFTIKVWYRIEQLIKKYPEYRKFEKIFKYDIKQIINAMEYDNLINKNHYLINKIEYWLYSPHTMQFIAMISIDLMCLSKFNVNELNLLREFIWQALKMTRISNCINTWEGEVRKNDFTSGIFAYAIEKNIVEIENLKKDKKEEIIKKIRKLEIEKIFLQEWENCYKKNFNLR